MHSQATSPSPRAATRPARLLTAAGLAGSLFTGSVAAGQADPLGEPFPVVFELSSLLPAQGGDGSLGSVFEGSFVGGYLGSDVWRAGDINGDGLDDVVLGARAADAFGLDGAGQAYVLFGSTAGFPATLSAAMLDGTNGFIVSGVRPGDTVGTTVAGVGDINGDGIDDVAVHSAGIDAAIGGTNVGAVLIIFGRDTSSSGPFPAQIEPSDLDGVLGFRFLGEREDDRCGNDIGPAGDINGDGIGDLAIGAELADPDGVPLFGGEAYIVYGRDSAAGHAFPEEMRPADLDGSNGFRFIDRSGSRTGRVVRAVGDVDGDGLGDLAVSSYFGNPPGGLGEEGVVYLVFGREPGTGGFEPIVALDTAVGDGVVAIDGINRRDRLGRSVVGNFDVNGDGRSDIVLGVPRTDPGGRPDAGSAFIIYGRETGNPFPDRLQLATLDGGDGFRIEGVSQDDAVGLEVDSAGDINGDGIDDVLIGSAGPHPAGGAYLVYGRASGDPFPAVLPLTSLAEDRIVRFVGNQEGDATGYDCAILEDVNGDGVDDIAIAAWMASPGGRREAGLVYLVYGRGGRDPCPVDLDGDGELTIFDFLVFQGLFSLGDPKADFDGDGSLTIFDFLAFQIAFDAGCP